MYQLSAVTKIYRKGRGAVEALSDLDLEIPDGQWLAIQGPTGHGKSTLLQLLGGLDRPTSGTVELDGMELGRVPERKLTKIRATSIGFIFQTFNLIPTLSAAENVQAALVPLGISPAQREARAERTLASVGLGDRLHHLPAELSGGSSSARPSPGPWSRNPPCCSPTNRPETSTSRPGTRSSPCWTTCGANSK
jgi:putative ABC transport system ATP-binding protein